ncbi:polysaccharide deacetylase family protein [Fimbriimonas ginsengisoli]|uniref:Polysaccharide deacetylase n=1 Tax=Fimbriimonas ginsengisoli Gsoil 348 TaxID=661478 RepID=A0A068NSF1_FIMGI|nr:polysaccharide deacetylase family protein [Fimbriimonas ginsengisoli]AIE84524.1 polysaccharide deacetylase [Fimbriimonas ginsengisoli Gsoil 348]
MPLLRPVVFSLFACLMVGQMGCVGPAEAPDGVTTGGGSAVTAAVLGKPVRVTNRQANTKGGVLVLMYHKFAPKETRYDRSFDHFRHDLQRLYDMGFRPVTMSEYLSDRLNIAPGASPVVITVDDSNSTQFTMRDDGTVDPECAVGIWQDFAAIHPDFPVKATWYVLPTVMWGQPKWQDRKVEILKESGSELASHTWSHPVLRKLTDRQVKTEIARSIDFLAKYGFDKVSFAYPYGVFPKHMDILDGFWQNHRAYTLTGAVTCDTDIAPAPAADDLRPFKVPRVEALEGPLGVDYWLDRIESGKSKVFVAP